MIFPTPPRPYQSSINRFRDDGFLRASDLESVLAQDHRARLVCSAGERVMKMGEVGFRPAFNVQFTTTCKAQVIAGMDVADAGSDMAQLLPMVEQVEQRLGQIPAAWLVMGAFQRTSRSTRWLAGLSSRFPLALTRS